MRPDYILKVWLSTLVITPVLLRLVSDFFSDEGIRIDSGGLAFIALAIVYGLVCSIPSFLIVSICSVFIKNRIANDINLKLVLWLTGIFCLLVTIYLLFGSDPHDTDGRRTALILAVSYFISYSFFSYVYTIGATHKSRPDADQPT